MDLALANVNKKNSFLFKHLPVDFSEKILGDEIVNYSYINDPAPNIKLTLTPRVNKGYIMRESKDRQNPEVFFIEVNFPALLGMSGSPIIKESNLSVIGIIYQNYRSKILEDEYEVEKDKEDIDEDDSTKIKKTYKVVDYGLAFNLFRYKDFILNAITILKNKKYSIK